jgi:hypothetical protein
MLLAPILARFRLPHLISCCPIGAAVAHEDRGRWTLSMLAAWSPTRLALRHRLAWARL